MNIKFLTFSLGFKDMIMKNTDNKAIKKPLLQRLFTYKRITLIII